MELHCPGNEAYVKRSFENLYWPDKASGFIYITNYFLEKNTL